MKKILLFLTLTTLMFACKKEENTFSNTNTPTTTTDVLGCTDSLATNYLAMANIDDGSCEYPPSKLELSNIIINTIPLTNNGNTWDWDITGLTSDPDIFYVLKKDGADVIFSNSQNNVSSYPISFTENLPDTLKDLSQEFTIELYDDDQIAGVGENELIGSCSFIPNEYITIGGNEINITNSGVDMTLDIKWLQ